MTESTFGGRSALQAAFAHALFYLESQDQARVGPRDGTDALRGRLFRKLEAEPTDPATVIEELVQDVEGGLLGMSGGRFYAWAIGGSLPAALAADWLTSASDQNATLYACSPAAAIVEEVVGAWLKELLNIPPSASFALVTGCQMATYLHPDDDETMSLASVDPALKWRREKAATHRATRRTTSE